MRLPALLAAIALATAPLPAFAATQTITSVQPSGQEAADQAIVVKATQSGSLRAAMAYEKDLAAVLDHAPASYPQIERKGDTTIVRSTSSQGSMSAAILLSAMNGKSGKPGTVATSYNTYAMAALLLGSIANEQGDPRKAITYLERGLALQPDNLMLVTETGTAMAALHRFPDALALYEKADGEDLVSTFLDPGGQARLLRAKGFVLVELNRLDDAETAYKASLKLEPNHAGAKGELDYIRKLRAGGPQQQINIVTGNKAESGEKAPSGERPPAKP